MKSAYKYLPSEYANLFLNKGKIKIGTLYDYRDIEAHGNEIGDQHEGIKTEYSHDKGTKTGNQLNRIEKKVFKGGADMKFQNNRVELENISQDHFIYCVSKSFSKSILEKLNNDFPKSKYDSCVEIVDIAKFIRDVSKALPNGKYICWRECVYIGRMHHYSKNTPHPAILKEDKYKYQEEVRFFWEPVKVNKIEPVIINLKNTKEYCKLIKI